MGNTSKNSKDKKRHVTQTSAKDGSPLGVYRSLVQSPSRRRVTPVTPLSDISPISPISPVKREVVMSPPSPLSPASPISPLSSLEYTSPSQSPTYKCNRCLRIFRNESNVNAHFWCKTKPRSQPSQPPSST